jgi:hypothetical protein
VGDALRVDGEHGDDQRGADEDRPHPALRATLSRKRERGWG